MLLGQRSDEEANLTAMYFLLLMLFAPFRVVFLPRSLRWQPWTYPQFGLLQRVTCEIPFPPANRSFPAPRATETMDLCRRIRQLIFQGLLIFLMGTVPNVSWQGFIRIYRLLEGQVAATDIF